MGGDINEIVLGYIRTLVELAGIILPLDVITHPEGSEPMGVMVVVLEPRPMPPTGTVGEFVVEGWAAVAVSVALAPSQSQSPQSHSQQPRISSKHRP